MVLQIEFSKEINEAEIITLYEANQWSSAKKPDALIPALLSSHSLVTARHNGRLIGIANAISDGYLVVYYPHMLVHPEYQRKGVGGKMMEVMQSKYFGFHQQMLVADGDAIGFYRTMGFERAGKTEPMWIYSGGDH